MKTKKLLLSVLAAFVCSFTMASAQDAGSSSSKPIVIVDQFTMPTNANGTYEAVVVGLRNSIISAIAQTQKVEIIDAATESYFQESVDASRSESALKSLLEGEEVRVAASKQYNAKYLIQGNISSMKGARSTLDDGSVYYTGELSASLNVLDLENGTIVYSKNYNYAGIRAATGDSEVSAVTNTGNSYLVAAMPAFVSNAFKTKGRIIDVAEAKKSNATSVYIDLGSNVGLSKGDKFKVMQIKMTAGREMRTEVGALVVTEVGGVDISTCKVVKCGELIMESLKADPIVKLEIESVKKGGFGSALGGIGKSLLN